MAGRLWRLGWAAVVVGGVGGGHHDQSIEVGGRRCRPGAVADVTVLVGRGGGRGVERINITGEKK